MADATATAPTGTQATGDAADEATEKGTAASDVSVQPGSTSEAKIAPAEGDTPASDAPATDGETPTEPHLRYSDEHLTAAKAEADNAGYKRGRVEYDTQVRERRKSVVEAFKGTDAELAPALRAIREEGVRQGLADAELNPVLERTRAAIEAATDAAMGVTAQTYADAIEAAFDTDDDRKAFWERAAGIDPALSASEVLRLYAETQAIKTDAVADAKPEDLLQVNKALVTYIAGIKDAEFSRGRGQGQKDPAGEHAGDGLGSQGSMTLAQIDAEPTARWLNRPKEQRERLLSQAHEAAARGR